MKIKLLFVAAVAFSLSACIGVLVEYPTKREHASTSVYVDGGLVEGNKETYLLAEGKPAEVEYKEDKEIWKYAGPENEWCGVILFIVIPVPIALPMCDEYQSVTFGKDGKARSIVSREVHGVGGICSPLLPVLGSMLGHHSDVDICE